jgi:hypothetical protein
MKNFNISVFEQQRRDKKMAKEREQSQMKAAFDKEKEILDDINLKE